MFANGTWMIMRRTILCIMIKIKIKKTYLKRPYPGESPAIIVLTGGNAGHHFLDTPGATSSLAGQGEVPLVIRAILKKIFAS